MLLQEKLTDFIRLNKLDEVAEDCHPAGPVFAKVPEESEELVERVVRTCLGEALGSLVPNYSPDVGKTKTGRRKAGMSQLQLLQTLPGKLFEAQKLPATMLSDLSTLSDLFRTEDDEAARVASERLEEMRADVNYFGVLRPLLHNQNWQCLVGSLSDAPARQSVEADLRQAFDALSNAFQKGLEFGETERNQLETALVRAAANAAATQRLATVMNGLILISEEACKTQCTLLLDACKELGKRGSAAMQVGLGRHQSEQILGKGTWSTQKIRLTAKHVKDDADPHGLLQICDRLEAANAQLGICGQLSALLFNLAEASQIHGDRGVDDEEARARLVDAWSALKSGLLDLKVLQLESRRDSLKEALEQALSSTRIESIGPQVHEESMQRFRLSATKLVTAATNSDGDFAARQAEVSEAAGSLKVLVHKTLQTCALSDTPVFARSCVSFACKELVAVCLAMPSAVSEPVPKDLLNYQLLSDLESVCDLETNKQKILQVLDKSVFEAFTTAATNVLDKLRPVFQETKASAQHLLQETTAALKDALVPDEGCSREEFLQKAAPGEKLKKLLKNLRAAEKSGHQICGPLGEKEQAELTDLKSGCKTQILKWGILTLLQNANLGRSGSAGDASRKALKDIWQANNQDEALLKALGDDTVKLVASSLEFKAPTTAEATGEGEEADGNGKAGKGSKKRRKS